MHKLFPVFFTLRTLCPDLTFKQLVFDMYNMKYFFLLKSNRYYIFEKKIKKNMKYYN
jgi:hypothetical protein